MLVFPRKSLLTVCEWLEVYMTFSKPANVPLVREQGWAVSAAKAQGEPRFAIPNLLLNLRNEDTGFIAFSEICRLHLMGSCKTI